MCVGVSSTLTPVLFSHTISHPHFKADYTCSLDGMPRLQACTSPLSTFLICLIVYCCDLILFVSVCKSSLLWRLVILCIPLYVKRDIDEQKTGSSFQYYYASVYRTLCYTFIASVLFIYLFIYFIYFIYLFIFLTYIIYFLWRSTQLIFINLYELSAVLINFN